MDSTMWLYIALAIVILGLIIAGIGVVLMIKGIKEPMKEMKGSADNLKDRMDKLKLETTSLQHNANELKEDMQEKSERVSGFVDAAKGTKNSVLDLNASVRAITTGIASRVDRDKRKTAEANQMSTTAVGLLNFWQDRKKKKASTSTSYSTAVPVERQR